MVSGTRESEQPSQRMRGDWAVASVGRRVGWVAWVEVDQRALEARAAVKGSVFVVDVSVGGTEADG